MKLRYHHIRWLVAVAALLVLPAMAQVRDTIDFDISDRTFEAITVDGETFNLYSYPDCDHIDQTGAPMLPVKYIRLSVPYNATDITVTASGDWTSGSTTRRIYPAPVPIPTDGSVTEDPEMVIDSAIYMTNAFWPAQPAELVGDGILMGENHIVTVAVYPMLYNPGASRMRNYSQVRVTVSYTPGGTPANMLVRYDSHLRQQERQQAMALVSNPEQVEPFSIPASQAQHAPVLPLPDSVFTDTIGWTYGGMLKSVESYDYMVITTRALKPAFKRLLALKQQKGYSAGAVCVEDILSNIHVANGDKSQLPDGSFSYINDDAGKIREYLKECYRYGTKYVLFGGENVPFRYGYANSDTNRANYEYHHKQTPTDFYYSELNNNWNIDDNSDYGENKYFKYQFDKYAELYVGRLQFTDKSTVRHYTDKLLTYELNPGNGNSSYLNRAILTECDNFRTLCQLSPLYNVTWPQIYTFIQQVAHVPSAEEVITFMNNNPCGIASMEGHGNPWTIYVNFIPDRECVIKHEGTSYFGSSTVTYGLDNLSNKYYPFVLYSYACTTTPFDTFTQYQNRTYTGDNFGQSFTLGESYGGVAFLGNTRVGYSAHSDKTLYKSALLEKKFISALNSGNNKVGIVESISKQNYNGQDPVYLCMVHNLIGDPEFDIWTNSPVHNNITNIIRADNSLTIEGLDSDGDLTYIGISDGTIQVMDSTVNNRLTITGINPNSTIMVYQHNYLPYIAPLFLQNERVERSQYVIANDVYAGRNVDTNRTAGDLIIAEGSEYEIETKGQVVLGPGFMVEKGALFSVTQSDY